MQKYGVYININGELNARLLQMWIFTLYGKSIIKPVQGVSLGPAGSINTRVSSKRNEGTH